MPCTIVKLLLPLLCAITGTQALWLAVANMRYSSAVGDSIFGSPYCQVGKGNTQLEAQLRAGNTVGATALIAGGGCNQMPYQHTRQLGGFWNDYGTVNYIDDNWHWYCKIDFGKYTHAQCDAGNGAPRRKRNVERQLRRERLGAGVELNETEVAEPSRSGDITLDVSGI